MIFYWASARCHKPIFILIFSLALFPLACVLLIAWTVFLHVGGIHSLVPHPFFSPHCMKLFLRALILSWHFCQGSEGYSPLLMACKFHKTDLVKYLLGFPEVDPSLKTSVSFCCKCQLFQLCCLTHISNI